jgi:hypothetical protein
VIDCKKLTYDPVCIGLFKDDYFLLGSNNNELNFYTKEGMFVHNITEGISDWVLSVKVIYIIIKKTLLNRQVINITRLL